MLSILGLISGLAGPIATVAGKIADLKTARVQADGDVAKAAIDAQIQALHDQHGVLVAEAWSRINMLQRAAIASGPTTYLCKYFIWDKVIGSFLGYSRDGSMFSTDGLDANMVWVMLSVVGFYFVATWKGR